MIKKPRIAFIGELLYLIQIKKYGSLVYIYIHILFRTGEHIPTFEDYLENEKNYCPSPGDNICKKFQLELEEKHIKCEEVRAARLKAYLQWKCKMKKSNSEELVDEIYPEHDLLPDHIRPQSYEIWLWVKEKPIIEGNVTIKVIVTGYMIQVITCI